MNYIFLSSNIIVLCCLIISSMTDRSILSIRTSCVKNFYIKYIRMSKKTCSYLFHIYLLLVKHCVSINIFGPLWISSVMCRPVDLYECSRLLLSHWHVRRWYSLIRCVSFCGFCDSFFVVTTYYSSFSKWRLLCLIYPPPLSHSVVRCWKQI